MRSNALPAISLFALLVAACSPSGERGPSGNTPDERAEYGPFVMLDGIYVSEFEVSAFHPCNGPQGMGTCEAGEDVGCWLVFSDEAVAQVDRYGAAFPGPEYPGAARVWGFGRIAREPGGFGHVNGYPCQVELAHVNRFAKQPADRPR